MKRIFSKRLRYLTLSLAALLVSCANILSSGQNTDSASSVQYSFELALGTGNWTEAITLYANLTASQQASRSNLYRLASAQAGRCGLNSVRLADLIVNGSSGLPLELIFPIFSNKAAAAALAAYDDCVDAVSTLSIIGTTADLRNADENVLMILVELAKISAIVAYRGDTTPQDGSVDATFTPCEDLNGAVAYGNLVTADQDQIAYAIGNLSDSFDNLPSTIPFVSDFRNGFSTICTAIALTGNDVCGLRSGGTVTVGLRRAARAIISEGTLIGYNRPLPSAAGSNIVTTYAGCVP
jgi:hypothetical protein